MTERSAFLLRLDPAVLEALKRWAADDLRSLNGQIEYLLRRALADAQRGPGKAASQDNRTDNKTDNPAPHPRRSR